MAFKDIFGNTMWKVVDADKKIQTLQEGSAIDKYDQILDILRDNRKNYLMNGQTQDEWTDRVLFFSFQKPIQNDGSYIERKFKLENDDTYVTEDSNNIILQNEPVFNISYLISKTSSWFNSETRCEVATKTLVKNMPTLANEDNTYTLDEVYKYALQHKDEGGTFFVKVLQNKELLERNYKLMQLSDVDISGSTKTKLLDIVRQPINRLIKFKFESQFMEDRLFQNLPNISSWLSQTFTTLDKYAQVTNG